MISLPVSNELISLIILFISGIVLNIYIVFHDAYYIYKNNNCKKQFIAYMKKTIINHRWRKFIGQPANGALTTFQLFIN